MKRIVLIFVAAIGLSAGSAHAAAFTTNFCPGDATCPAGITQARIVFDEILTGGDPNDYNLYLIITGGATAPAFITAVDFTIDGIKGEVGAGSDDYASVPVLLAAPGGTGKWTVSFDKLNQGSECNGGGAGQAVCAESIGVGTTNAAIAPNTTNIWKLFVNLDGSSAISAATKVDFRAQFATLTGGNGGQLSPGSQFLNGTCVDCVPTERDVPEPTTLALLGFGLLGAGVVRRRK